MPANGPAAVSYLMRIGVDELLFSNLTATGIPQTTGLATNVNAVFGFPPQSMNWRGHLILAASPIGGTITTATISLLSSLDGGATTPTVGIWSGGVFTPYTGINLIGSGTANLIELDISGFGGNGQMTINLTTLTKGTGSGINIYGRIG